MIATGRAIRYSRYPLKDDEESLHRPVHDILHKSLSRIESAETSDDLVRPVERRPDSGYSWTRNSETDLRATVSDRSSQPAKRARISRLWAMAIALVALLFALLLWRASA
jgi:hypothetical protein